MSEVSAADVRDLLMGYRFRGVREADYQQAIEDILAQRVEVPFEREVWLTRRDRIDFLFDGGLGIEVKVDDTRAKIIRQLGRYAQSERVTELLLASSRPSLVDNIPDVILGVPVMTLALRGALL